MHRYKPVHALGFNRPVPIESQIGDWLSLLSSNMDIL